MSDNIMWLGILVMSPAMVVVLYVMYRNIYEYRLTVEAESKRRSNLLSEMLIIDLTEEEQEKLDDLSKHNRCNHPAKYFRKIIKDITN